jgi:hypothetical protein
MSGRHDSVCEALYHAVNQMMARLGHEGEIAADDPMCTAVMDALRAIDGGTYRASSSVKKQRRDGADAA